MDLSTLELDDDTKVKILALHEADILGLKNKNTDLIEREKAAKLELETEKLATVQSAEDQKVALAEATNDVAKYKLAVDERDTAMATLKVDIAEKNNEALMATAVDGFSSGLTDDPAGRQYMQSLYKNGVHVVDGVLAPKDVTLDMDKFTSSLVSDKANSSYIKAVVGSGSDSVGSNGVINNNAEQSTANLWYK